MAKKNWYKDAVYKRPPYTLGGWNKKLPPTDRLKKALASRPSSWSLRKRYRSAGQALIALSNVSKDYDTKVTAKRDAHYFFDKLK